MEKKYTKRQIQAQNTKNKIYTTAVELMNNKGLNNVTVEEICKSASVSIGSFYNCFKSKSDILNEIFKEADQYFLIMVVNNLNSGSLQDKISQFFNFYAEYVTNKGIDFVKNLYNAHNIMFIAKGRPMQLVLLNIIKSGMEEGEIINDMTPEEMVEYLFIAARGIVYDWCLHDGNYDLCAFTDKYLKRLIKVLI